MQSTIQHTHRCRRSRFSDTTPELHPGRDYQPSLPTTSNNKSSHVSESPGRQGPESNTMSAPEDHNIQGTNRLNPETRLEILQMMREFYETLEPRQRSPRRSSTTPETSTSRSAETTTTSLEASEIGYFFPNMPLDWGDKDMVEKDDKMYYRSVHFFTNRIRVLAQTRDPNKLKPVLDSCLRGEAELWWNNQLSNATREAYLSASSIDIFCKVLEERFRLPPSEAFAKYNTTRYTVDDKRFGLVIQAWMHLDLPLRETVDEPAPGTTFEEFAGMLLRKQNNWFDRFPPRSLYPRQPDRSHRLPELEYKAQ